MTEASASKTASYLEVGRGSNFLLECMFECNENKKDKPGFCHAIREENIQGFKIISKWRCTVT